MWKAAMPERRDLPGIVVFVPRDLRVIIVKRVSLL